ncbi:gliding motility-associated lipoprotein [Puteibacter caeruleilacunae]|nr:gliding motility-associated lipoprotein [Puteibacter caeruleilacunae]
MKKFGTIGLIMILSFLLFSCKKDQVRLLKDPAKRFWYETRPHGMVYVPAGSYSLGVSDQDIMNSYASKRTVSVGAFWMDDTEITNSEYRTFVHYVRDSIARTLLAEQFPEFVYEDELTGETTLNWEEKIDWKDNEYQIALEDLFLNEKERYFSSNEVDARKLVYEYYHIDLKQAARGSNRYNYESQSYNGTVIIDGVETPIENRSSFIQRHQVPIYPDTLCWVRDYSYAYNEPKAIKYFWHPAFSNYPVVGVSWKQAKAFCDWRTQKRNDHLKTLDEPAMSAYRLPTEAEWEIAARGGRIEAMYPWGGYYTRTQQGCFMANFKPMRGNYVSDNMYGTSTVKVATYMPNDYNLYDMAGNVAEWTSTAYDESAYDHMSDFNPSYEYEAASDDHPALKRKVIRGGSWKDIANFLQVSTRDYEYQDSVKSYIGFRCVQSSFGNIIQY